MGDLVAWLTQIWDEQEASLKWTTNRGSWVADGLQVKHLPTGDPIGRFSYGADADHAARWQPASVLARIAADRQILAEHKANLVHFCSCCRYVLEPVPYPCRTVKLLAQPYADRPGFRDEWRVSA